MRLLSLRANQLPEELLEVYQEAFYLLDPQDTGGIGENEIGIVMRAIGQDPTEEEIKAVMSEMDSSGKGCLNFNEFLSFLAHIHQEDDPDEEWEMVFKHFDRNGDGYIDEMDLRKTLVELRLKFTDADVEEMISEFIPPNSKSKKLDFFDFLNIVT